MTAAAKIVGIERSTLYRHIDEKGISVIKKEGGHPKIDVSELIRVYGDQVNPDRLKSNKKESDDTKTKDNATKNDPNDATLSARARIELLEEERKREREQYQDQIENLKESLKLAQEGHNKATLLLEHQSNEKPNNKEWVESFKALENRIANQEKVAKEKAEADALEKTALEKQLTEQKKEIKEQEQALQEAKDADLKRKEEEYEAAQTWVSKMFGKKKTA